MNPKPFPQQRTKLCWQERWLRGAYVLLFAAVLPLLCWGDIADPRHPHWYAHFVFLEPHGAERPNLHGAERPSIISHDHEPCLHPPAVHSPAATMTERSQPLTPNGQAVPTTLLAQLVMLVMWTVSRLIKPPMIPLLTWLNSAILSGITLRVPTPPPRHCAGY